jgi:hypothetical protein
MLEVLGIKNAEKLVPIEDDMMPRDPVSENMAFLTGKPTKAFMTQDQDAHISIHMAMMQDPVLMAQIGQSPQAQKMQAAILAHVSEHLAFAYRKKVEEQLGVPLPPPDENLPPDTEVLLSRLVAQAAQQVLAQSKGEAQQQQAEEAAKDPLVQIQQAELEIKKQDADTKAKKVEGDLVIKQAELELKQRQAGEDPQMMAQRHQQEMAQQQAQLQMMQQKHAQEMGQGQEVHQQGMAHGGHVHAQNAMQNALTHRQKMTHAERAAANQQRQAEVRAAQTPRKEPK